MKRNKNRRMTLLCIAVITAMLFTSIGVNAAERGDAVTEPSAASGSTEVKSDNDDIIIEPAEADDETEIQNVNENDSSTTEKQPSLDSAKAQARRVSNYTIKVNTRYNNQYRTGSDHIMKYKFTVPESGVVTPVIYVDEKYINNFVGWNDYIYNSSMTKAYSEYEKIEDYEDANGHQWIRVKFNKCRLAAGTYYLYLGDPGSALNEYYHFSFVINYKSEKSRKNVEKEFNDTRNTANSVSFNKTYYGNSHYKDVDYFKFKVKSKTKVSLYFYSASGYYDYKFETRIVNSKGKEVGVYQCLGEVEDSKGNEYEKYLFQNTLKEGTYYFRVSGFYESYPDYKFIVKTTPSKVTGLKLTKKGGSKVKVSYKSAARASKYEIYRKASDGVWKKVKTTTARSWTNSSQRKGKYYSYKVRAVNGSYKGSFSSTKKIKVN